MPQRYLVKMNKNVINMLSNVINMLLYLQHEKHENH